MARTKNLSIVAALVALTALVIMPAADAFHGGWWRGFDRPTTHAMFPNPGSRAISATGQVFDLDFQWGGGGGLAGTATIEMFDPATGALVHSNTVVAAEDISSVTWITCPFPNSGGALLEEVPLYSIIAPGVLNLGPGAPGGTGDMRNSFCNDTSVPDGGNPVANDPLYYKAFSDYTGTYIIGGAEVDCSQLTGSKLCQLVDVDTTAAPVLPTVFQLEVHVRDLDHA